MIVPVGSTAWLLLHELRLARRGMMARPGMKWRAPLLIGVFLIGGLFIGVPAALALKRFGLPPTAMVCSIAALATLAVFTFMLSQSLASATETLYARDDLDLLFSSPIAPRKVLIAKCAGIAANTFNIFALLVTPAVVPVAILVSPAWLAVYVVLAALALFATALGLAIAIGLFRLIGPKRTRTIAQMIAILVGAAVFLVAQSRNLVGQTRFNRWLGAVAGSGPAGGRIHGPLAWPLRALSGEPAILVGRGRRGLREFRRGDPSCRAALRLGHRGGQRRRRRRTHAREAARAPSPPACSASRCSRNGGCSTATSRFSLRCCSGSSTSCP